MEEGLAIGTINLFVLPLLGGYWFQYKFVGTHYRAERLTPQRLLFHTALFGLMLFGAARLLVDMAIAQWQPDDMLVKFDMFSVAPGFIVVVLYSLLAIAWQAYGPGLGEEADVPPLIPSAIDDSDDNVRSSLWRAVLGATIGAILLVLGSFIVGAMRAAASIVTDLGLIGVILVVVAAAKLHHEFLSRYMDFPFFSILLRLGLFGVIGSLGIAVFITNFPIIHLYWDSLVQVRGSGISVLAGLMGLVLWWPLNLLYPYQVANTRLQESSGTSALDRLLYQASLKQHLLAISMKDGKVYIGYIQELPQNPEDRSSYFEILPIHSGYRDTDTREMTLTTFYETAYERLVQSQAGPDEWLVFRKVLKIDDIVSAGRFDPKAYVRFQEEQPEEPQDEQPPSDPTDPDQGGGT